MRLCRLFLYNITVDFICTILNLFFGNCLFVLFFLHTNVLPIWPLRLGHWKNIQNKNVGIYSDKFAIISKKKQHFRNDFVGKCLICSRQNKPTQSFVFTMRANQQLHLQQCSRARTSKIKRESKSTYMPPHFPPKCWV